MSIKNKIKSFFNTTKEVEELPEYTQKAEKQDERVIEILTKAKEYLTPYEVWVRYCNYYNSETPITSIRRSLTVLTNQGLLGRLEVKKIGNYGRKTYQWGIKQHSK